MATQNINIVISSTGGVTVVRNIQQIGNAAEAAINPLSRLQRQLDMVMTALAIHKITEWADEWTSAANKVAIFSKSQADTNLILDKLFNISTKLGQPLNETVDLYHKLSIQSKALGSSTNENIQFTENVSKALAIQGTNANTARGVLLQLSQAMGTGRVKAQEYNSMLTGAPLLLKMVAEQMDAAGGSVAKLTNLQRSGALSSKDLYDAILKSTTNLDAMWDKTTRTFGQAFQNIESVFVKFLGQLNEATGLSNDFFKATQFIKDNLDTISKSLMVMGVAVAAAFAPTLITLFAQGLELAAVALGRVTLLLLANPFVAIATAVAAVIAFGDSWDAGIDKMTTVKDVFRALWDSIVTGLQEVGGFFSDVWNGIVYVVTNVFAVISRSLATAVGGWFSSFSTFYDDVGTGFIGVLRGIAKTMDAIAGLILGVVIGIGRVFGQLPDVIENIFAGIYNIMAGYMEKGINVMIDGINTVRSKVGASLLDTVSFEKKNIDTKVFQNYGQSIANAIDDGFAMQGGFMVKQIDALEKKAQLFSANRKKVGSGVDDLNDHTTPESAIPKKAKKDTELNKLQNDLRTLLNRIQPASGALLEMAKAEKVLDDAVNRGLITNEQRLQYLPLLKQHYVDIIDPLGKYNRLIGEQLSLNAYSARDRGVEATLMKTKQDLLMKGQPMTDRQIDDMRTLLQLQRDLNEATAAKDALEKGSMGEGNRGFAVQIKAMQDLMKDPSSGFKKSDATNALQSSMSEMFAGTKEMMDLQVAQWDNMYTRIKQLQDAHLISSTTATQMQAKVAAQQNQVQLQNYTNFFTSLESLSSSSNSKIAAIGRAAAITNATIKGVEAVQVALASAPPPWNYALAAAVGIQAAANVAKIASTPAAFATGGDFIVGGSGGVDSQMVAFRASPGEQVAISTPQQVRHGSGTKGNGGDAPAPVFKPNIVNVLDPSLLAQYLATSDGEKAILNVIQNNPSVVRSAATGGR